MPDKKLIVGDGTELRAGWYIVVKILPERPDRVRPSYHGAYPVYISFDKDHNPLEELSIDNRIVTHPLILECEVAGMTLNPLKSYYPLSSVLEYADSLEQEANFRLSIADFVRKKEAQLEKSARQSVEKLPDPISPSD
jgi:hypothetical protein